MKLPLKAERRCYDVNEAAEVLGISPKLYREQMKRGLLPFLKLGRIYRIPINQLNDYINETKK